VGSLESLSGQPSFGAQTVARAGGALKQLFRQPRLVLRRLGGYWSQTDELADKTPHGRRVRGLLWNKTT